jgi:uncharacterized membrane protein
LEVGALGESRAVEPDRRRAIVSASVVIVVAAMVSITGYLVGTMVQSIRKEKRKENLRKTWANFGLSIAFAVLFLHQLDRPWPRPVGHLSPRAAGPQRAC